VEHNERMDENEMVEFEQKLRIALQRREAPLGLKQRVLSQARERRQAERGRWWMVNIAQRIAASAVLAAIFGGAAVYHRVEERRKGEAAREQVLTALRITSKTLDRVGDKLAESGR
jgi:hypothetical protein